MRTDDVRIQGKKNPSKRLKGQCNHALYLQSFYFSSILRCNSYFFFFFLLFSMGSTRTVKSHNNGQTCDVFLLQGNLGKQGHAVSIAASVTFLSQALVLKASNNISKQISKCCNIEY